MEGIRNKLNYILTNLQNFSNKHTYTTPQGIKSLQKTLSKHFSIGEYKVEKILFGNGLKEIIYIMNYLYFLYYCQG